LGCLSLLKTAPYVVKWERHAKHFGGQWYVATSDLLLLDRFKKPPPVRHQKDHGPLLFMTTQLQAQSGAEKDVQVAG
jgi:hypothetical protein